MFLKQKKKTVLLKLFEKSYKFKDITSLQRTFRLGETK